MATYKFNSVLKIFLAVIVGEIVLVLGTILVQEVIFHGIDWYSSNLWELTLAGLGSFAVAAVAGAAAYWVVNRNTETPIGILSLLVIVETFWIIQTGRATGPIWFEVLAATTLIAGFWAGRFLLKGWNWKVAG